MFDRVGAVSRTRLASCSLDDGPEMGADWLSAEPAEASQLPPVAAAGPDVWATSVSCCSPERGASALGDEAVAPGALAARKFFSWWSRTSFLRSRPSSFKCSCVCCCWRGNFLLER